MLEHYAVACPRRKTLASITEIRRKQLLVFVLLIHSLSTSETHKLAAEFSSARWQQNLSAETLAGDVGSQR